VPVGFKGKGRGVPEALRATVRPRSIALAAVAPSVCRLPDPLRRRPHQRGIQQDRDRRGRQHGVVEGTAGQAPSFVPDLWRAG
jgi:hypothetical protein